MDKPIVFIDLETTGTDVINDRIIQIAARKGDDKPRKYLIYPGIDIPAAATEIHGITNEMVKDKPLFKQIAKGLIDYLAGCNIAGFNILDFDIPLLDEEFRRAGLIWQTNDIHIFDSCRIFRNKEKRDLAAAVKFYTGREHVEAHDAGVDIAATEAVFFSQLGRYGDLDQMSDEQLAEFCAGGRRLDLAGKILLNEQNQPIYSFGTKTKGKLVTEDLGFANWILKNDFPANTKEVVKRIIG